MTQPKLNVTKIRHDFPILDTFVNGHELVYLDNAATSQKPNVVIEAVYDFYREDNANVHRGVHALSARATKQFDAARETVRRYIGAKHDHEIIFTKGCTEGINLVAQSYGRPKLKPGDEILISTMEHHSNIVPWQILCEQTGATLKVIPITDSGELVMESLGTLISERTKIVGVVHVSNAMGTINPIKEIAKRAHAVGAVILVDGAQAGPHLPIDVQDLDADFYTLSCHKAFAPTGVGVLYGKERLLNAMPPYHGGGDMIRTVSLTEGTTYAGLPNKFEAGTPNVAGIIGLGAAFEYVMGIGREAIVAHEHELVTLAMGLLSDIDGVKLSGTAKDKAGVVSFTMDAAHPHDIGTVLDNEGIAIRAGHHCCMPLMARFGIPATARASFAFYNTKDEVEALGRGVKKIKELFG